MTSDQFNSSETQVIVTKMTLTHTTNYRVNYNEHGSIQYVNVMVFKIIGLLCINSSSIATKKRKEENKHH